MTQIYLPEAGITYHLQRKNVKNINLRIHPDGLVFVSANRRVPQSVIDAFVLSKVEFIRKAQLRLTHQANVKQQPCVSEENIRDVILAFCEKAYPYFKAKGIPYPQIKFRRMVSRWGSCHATKGILTFNTNLMYAPLPCIEYVVLHEFTHFLQANHSKAFYDELAKVCPTYQERRKQLKEIRIPRDKE